VPPGFGPYPARVADTASPGSLITEAMLQRRLSVDELSQSTRLRAGLLEQMIVDDFVETGGEVYARGHLRVIAGVLGLDPADLLASYDGLSACQRPPAT